MVLVLNMVIRVFLATVLSSYTFLWIMNNYVKWLKWASTFHTCMSNSITETKWKMLLVFDCLCWNLDFVSFCHACLIDFIQELTDFAYRLVWFLLLFLAIKCLCSCLDALASVLTDPEYQPPSLRLSPVVFA